MRVYGDRIRSEDPHAKLDAIEAAWTAAARRPPGLLRRGALAEVFVETSELAQGLADLEFAAAGEDDATPLQDAVMALLKGVARAVAAPLLLPLREKVAGGAGRGEGKEALARLRPLLPRDAISTKLAEGHAFYVVYPEAYFEAARALAGPVRCIGLRSIGAGLAAMAAVAAGDPAPATLRPVGPPFRRQVRVSTRLRARLLADPAATFAVADEGPGLSGSSFGAIADWLEGQGVARERVVFLPSHPGDPGPQADPGHLRRWATARRLTIDFDDLRRRGALPPLERWFADVAGEPVAPLDDLSAGAWRERRGAAAPAHAALERRKYLLRTGRGAWLLKFAGLGREGRAKFDRARALHAAGFTPEPVALRHGFLAERWRDDARPLAEGERVPVERLAAYLAFRARAFPAERPGASLAELADMARVNAAEALGARAAAALAWTEAELAELQRAVRPVMVDARLHRWEWLRPPEGPDLKTDALDHACAHDLVGPQDLAWDLAGAAVEHDLTPEDEARLLGLCGYGAPAGRALAAFMRLGYLAFQLGLWSVAGDDDGRSAALVRRYAEALERRLG